MIKVVLQLKLMSQMWSNVRQRHCHWRHLVNGVACCIVEYELVECLGDDLEQCKHPYLSWILKHKHLEMHIHHAASFVLWSACHHFFYAAYYHPYLRGWAARETTVVGRGAIDADQNLSSTSTFFYARQRPIDLACSRPVLWIFHSMINHASTSYRSNLHDWHTSNNLILTTYWIAYQLIGTLD